jgi:phosphatidylglycerophosphatase C
MPSVNQTSTVRPVAAFDFDGTLTRRDTLLPFLMRSLGWFGLTRALLLNFPWLAAFALGLISNHKAKARLLDTCLRGRNAKWVQQHTKDFIKYDLPLLWRPWCMEQLLMHQAMGHQCVIVSASPGIYLHAVGESLGVDAVLCTEMELVDGSYSGRMATPNCHGEEKVRRLKEWFDTEPPLEMHAYGDTRGDIPMLRMAQHAWYRGKSREHF